MRWWGNNLRGCGVMQAEFFNLQLLSLLFECDLSVCPTGPHEACFDPKTQPARFLLSSPSLSFPYFSHQMVYFLLWFFMFSQTLILSSLISHWSQFSLFSPFMSNHICFLFYYLHLSINLFFSFTAAVIKPGSNFHHLSFALSSRTLNSKELLSSDGLLFTPPCFGGAVGALCLSLFLLGPSLV